MRRLQRSSIETTVGLPLMNLAFRMETECQEQRPASPFVRERSKLCRVIVLLNPYSSTIRPNSLLQSKPRQPRFARLSSIGRRSISSNTQMFSEFRDRSLTVPSRLHEHRSSGSSISLSIVISSVWCRRWQIVLHSNALRLRLITEHILSSPEELPKAQYRERGSHHTLLQLFSSRLGQESTQRPGRYLRGRKQAPSGKSAASIIPSSSTAMSCRQQYHLLDANRRVSLRVKLLVQTLTSLAWSSRLRKPWSLSTQTSLRMGFERLGSAVYQILYSRPSFEQAASMMSLYARGQAVLSSLLMASIIYSVNYCHSRWPSPSTSMLWNRLTSPSTSQYLSSTGLLSYSISRIVNRKTGNYKPLGYSLNYFYKRCSLGPSSMNINPSAVQGLWHSYSNQRCLSRYSTTSERRIGASFILIFYSTEAPMLIGLLRAIQFMKSAEGLANQHNVQQQQLRQALRVLEEELERTDLPVGEQEELRTRITALKSKLQNVGIAPAAPAKEITLERIVHLREIFTHYCTHIFRVGRHMTFERLEYEKAHMTMDRFFVFLRDFRLTTANGESRSRELVGKAKIINIFKKVSSNAKDITFEQFIECLDRIALLHYDESMFVADSKHRTTKKKKKESRKPIKEQQQPKRDHTDKTEAREEAGQLGRANDQIENETTPIQLDQPQLEKGSDQQADEVGQEQPQKEDPSKSIREKNSFEVGDIDFQQDAGNEASGLPEQDKQDGIQQKQATPFNIPNSQKIEAFFKLIGVDSVRQYRKKLGQLNLPMFKSAQTRKASSIQLGQVSSMERLDQPAANQEDSRMQQIRNRISEQIIIDTIKRKSPKLPPPATEQNDYYKMMENRIEKREREKQKMAKARQAKKQMQDQYTRKLMQRPPPPPSKRLLNGPSYKATNVTWDDLERLNFEQVVRRGDQFHPHHLYDIDAQDEEYMGDLKFDPKAMDKYKMMARQASKKEVSAAQPQRDRASSQLDAIASRRQKKTSLLVDSTKKRASELAQSEKRKEAAADRMAAGRIRSTKQLM